MVKKFEWELFINGKRITRAYTNRAEMRAWKRKSDKFVLNDMIMN